MRVLRAADLVPTPWKNGGGTTREIAVHPEGAGFDGFLWRVSMANVAVDGPFSLFPGIDRTLILLDGDGITLARREQPPVTLKAGDHLDFRADIPIEARLVGAAVTDLNIMTRRGKVAANVTRRSVAGKARLDLAGDTALLFCLSGEIEATLASGTTTLRRHDTLRIDAPIDLAVHLDGTGEALAISLVAIDPA